MQNDELTAILISLQKKFNMANEIMNLTKELERAIYSNDEVSIKMLVSMRQDIIDLIDDIDNKNKHKIEGMPEDLAARINSIMTAQERPSQNDYSDIENHILDAVKRIKTLFKNIVVIDNVINKKLNVMNNK